MKYDLALPNAGPDARTLGELAIQAEQAGWDGIFLEDYIVWQRHQEEECAYIQSLAEAGATRWLENADPDLGLEGMRQTVSREPLRVAP